MKHFRYATLVHFHEGLIILRLTIRHLLYRLELKRRGVFADSTFLSLIVRPLLETEKGIRMLLAGPLMAAAVMGGVSQIPVNDVTLDTWLTETPIQPGVLAYTVAVPNGGEESTYLLPVEQLTGVSQYYHQGHPGIDLRAPLGTNVLAMDNGVVERIAESQFGYGRHILIKHTNGLETMYAHLGLIKVEEGETVSAGEAVATVGLTGWSTGPHLHFEVYADGSRTNPMVYLGKTLTALKESVQTRTNE